MYWYEYFWVRNVHFFYLILTYFDTGDSEVLMYKTKHSVSRATSSKGNFAISSGRGGLVIVDVEVLWTVFLRESNIFKIFRLICCNRWIRIYMASITSNIFYGVASSLNCYALKYVISILKKWQQRKNISILLDIATTLECPREARNVKSYVCLTSIIVFFYFD